MFSSRRRKDTIRIVAGQERNHIPERIQIINPPYSIRRRRRRRQGFIQNINGFNTYIPGNAPGNAVFIPNQVAPVQVVQPILDRNDDLVDIDNQEDRNDDQDDQDLFTIGNISIFFEQEDEIDQEDIVSLQDYSNTKYYRNFGAYIYSTPNYTSIMQIFLMKYFNYKDGTVTVQKNKFVIVALFNVRVSETERRLISSCTNCATSNVLPYYFLNCNEINQGEFLSSELYSCEHVFCAVSQLRYSLNFNLNEFDNNYGEKLYKFLCDQLIDNNTDLIPAQWYHEEEITYTTKKGKLSVYFSDSLELICVTKAQTKTGRQFLYCFDCPRSISCKHSRLIPNMKIYDLADLPDINGKLKLILRTR
jgi:hypothetical protein